MCRTDQPFPSHQPSFDDTAGLAYELYEHRGRQAGQEWEDWFEAEDILFLEAYVSQLQENKPQQSAEVPPLPAKNLDLN